MQPGEPDELYYSRDFKKINTFFYVPYFYFAYTEGEQALVMRGKIYYNIHHISRRIIQPGE